MGMPYAFLWGAAVQLLTDEPPGAVPQVDKGHGAGLCGRA